MAAPLLNRRAIRLREPAPAKVNLTLEILGRRPDGYHELRSVFRTLALHDTLLFEPAPDIAVRCTDPALAGSDNLAYRAARLLQARTGAGAGALITILKRIPVAAGLGGGSSDGAAALRGLNTLWRAGLSARELAELAASLGSDVPFFLVGGTARAAGRGEVLRPLPHPQPCPVLLVKPPIAVSTAAIYRLVTPDLYGTGEHTARFEAMAAQTPPGGWPLYNALQALTCRAHPIVAEVLESLQRWGATQSLMCGSGPTCFGLFRSETVARHAATLARRHGWWAWVTQFR
jgi:4-diphosphocytidyl-2-C-methyl-D-erythritol kinase